MTYLKTLILTRKTSICTLVLLLTGLLSSNAFSQQEEVIFSASGDSAWRLYLGSSSNWMVPVQGDVTTSFKSKVVTVSKIDNLATKDAIQAAWKNGLGQIYWQEDSARDYRELSEQGGALSMVIRIDKAPKKTVNLKMDCGYPCAGSLDMTRLFKSVPKDQWFRISLKLSCFEAAGANMSNIVAPLVIATTGAFKLSISDARLMSIAPEGSLVDCG